MIYEAHGTRLCQGGIFRGLGILVGVEIVESPGNPEDPKLQEVFDELAYAAVLSQECDLQWDHHFRTTSAKNQDKFLNTILVCPAFPAAQVKEGKHLEEQGMLMTAFGSDQWKLITRNGNSRYHYLAADSVLNIPELVLDFKRFQTAPRDVLIESLTGGNAVGALKPLFREFLSQRFANYLCRIGLPDEVPPIASPAAGSATT